jgi:hypothetical protein
MLRCAHRRGRCRCPSREESPWPAVEGVGDSCGPVLPESSAIEVCHRYAIAYGHTYHCSNPNCLGRAYGSHQPLHPRALQAYRCSHCKGPLVASEGMAPDRAPVSHIRRAPKASRHADRCRQSPSEQAGLVLWYLGLKPRRDLALWAGGPRGRAFICRGLSALWKHIRTHAPRIRARYEVDAALVRAELSARSSPSQARGTGARNGLPDSAGVQPK